MADSKDSALTNAAPLLTDLFAYVKDPAGTPLDQQNTFQQVRNLVQRTTETASVSTTKKIDVSLYNYGVYTLTADTEIGAQNFVAGLPVELLIDPDGNTITYDAAEFTWLQGVEPPAPSTGQKILISGRSTGTVIEATWLVTGQPPVDQSWQTLVETATVIEFDGASGINAKIAEADVDSANTLDVPDNIADGQTGSILVQGGAAVSWFSLNSAWKLGKTAAGASRALSDTTLPTSNTDAVLLTYQRLGSTYILLPCDNTFYPWS